jgi:hypothetical protein
MYWGFLLEKNMTVKKSKYTPKEGIYDISTNENGLIKRTDGIAFIAKQIFANEEQRNAKNKVSKRLESNGLGHKEFIDSKDFFTIAISIEDYEALKYIDGLPYRINPVHCNSKPSKIGFVCDAVFLTPEAIEDRIKRELERKNNLKRIQELEEQLAVTKAENHKIRGGRKKGGDNSKGKNKTY